jgi:hypothetical protein
MASTQFFDTLSVLHLSPPSMARMLFRLHMYVLVNCML